MRHAVGVDKIMWGSDYPHRESSYPFSNEALRLSFAGIDPVEVQQMLGGNAARLFGFDMDTPQRCGPSGWVRPMTRSPGHSSLQRFRDEAGRCPAFAGVT